jgi:CHAT domain-containing protein
LIHTQRDIIPVHKTDSKILLIAEPSAPGQEEIPATLEEIDRLAEIVPPESILTLSGLSVFDRELGATVGAVSERLKQAHVVHLACHGVQDWNDPLKSGFCLRDGRLTIDAIMRFQLQNAMFAFCSACETAKGDVNQPDQSIHLAAAMLFAGFRSVVGTMW